MKVIKRCLTNISRTALSFFFLFIGAVQGSVITTGCAGPGNACTLQELVDGGTIFFDSIVRPDILYSNFFFDYTIFGQDFPAGQEPNPADIIVSAFENSGNAELFFNTNGEIKEFDENYVEYTIGFDVSPLSIGRYGVTGEALVLINYDVVDFLQVSSGPSGPIVGTELNCPDPDLDAVCRDEHIVLYDPLKPIPGRVDLFARLAGDEPEDGTSLNEFAHILGFARIRIPEPTTLALFCLGLVGLGWPRRDRA